MGTFLQSVFNVEGNGRCEVKEPGVVGTSCTNVPSIFLLSVKEIEKGRMVLLEKP
jgi:hypothetical protein